MLGLIWLRGSLTRRPGRLLACASGIALAVALLASIGAFLASSRATMTRRAVQNVAVDWQVEAQPGADPAAVLATTARHARATQLVGFAQTTGLEATTATTGGTSTQTTGPGVVLGLPTSYERTFPRVIRSLTGARAGVLLAQQTAANLHVMPGDSVSIGRAGLPPFTVRVDGVVDLPQADSLFQRVGAPAGAQPQAPPDNVVLLPAELWHSQFDALAVTHPDQVTSQVHASVSRALPADPAAAYNRVAGSARNLELALSGSGLVGDNLGATLSTARSDALYAQVLFLFLGLPGAVLAALLSAAVVASGAGRRRREQALLRTRGATSATLMWLAGLDAALIGVIGAAAGLAIAALVGWSLFHGVGFGATPRSALAWAAAAAFAGVFISVLVVAVPAWHDARTSTVVGARLVVGRRRAPRWMTFGLDFVLLAASVVVFTVTSRNGYQLVLAPEGTPTISVSYWALAGPALLWLGAGLLAWRVAYVLLGARRVVGGVIARPFSGTLADTVGATMYRQRRVLAGALALVAWTTAFAASTAVFNATYKAQSDIDARLTNGADVTVTEPPGTQVGPKEAGRLTALGGVQSVEPLQHRYAYVGADLQDLYGVRPSTIVHATKLQDAYFQGGSARELVRRLDARPDGILVSSETVHDFQLRPGDTLRLRLQDSRTKQLTDVPFHYLGVALEFPTAPRDSFLVANASYVARMTGSDAVGAFLVDTRGSSPAAVAAEIRAEVGTAATVTDVSSARTVVGSSLTAVDLSGLTRVELGFAIVLAAAATGLALALGYIERRRAFAIATSLGASPHQLGGFVWSEAVFVTTGGLAAGALIGWALTAMLVKVLTGVFDPPPAALAVPWTYLAVVAAVSVAAVVAAGFATIAEARRAPAARLREL